MKRWRVKTERGLVAVVLGAIVIGFLILYGLGLWAVTR